MLWLALAALLSAGFRPQKIDVHVQDCTPKGVAIVLDGHDDPIELSEKEHHWTVDLNETLVMNQKSSASLRLTGHRTDCHQVSPKSDKTVYFTFRCDESPAKNVTVTLFPKKLHVDDVRRLRVDYVRRLDGSTPKCDCVERGEIRRRSTIKDVRLDEERVILLFGTHNQDASGLDVHKYILPPKKGALDLGARSLPNALVVQEQADQRAKDTGYVAPIAIDIDEKALKDIEKLTIEVVDAK